MTTGVFRVKVYALDDEEQHWNYRGSGNLTVKFSDKLNCLAINVADEASINTIFGMFLLLKFAKHLLETKVYQGEGDDFYKRDQEKIITWQDPDDDNRHFAFSFDNATDASLIYLRLITKVHSDREGSEAGSLRSDSTTKENRPIVLPREIRLKFEKFEHFFENEEQLISNLEEVFMIFKDLIKNRDTLQDYRSVVSQVIDARSDPSFLERIITLFSSLEESKRLIKLGTLAEFVKFVIQSAEPRFFEVMLKESVFPSICGILEYDPEKLALNNPLVQIPKYRELFQKSNFNNVIGIKNPEALAKIAENYRIAFFKDVILNRILQEIPYGLLSDIEQVTYAELISILHQDNCFIQTVFSKMRSQDVEESSNALKFVRELFFHVKSLEEVQAVVCYQSFEKPNLHLSNDLNLYSMLHSVMSFQQLSSEDVFCCGEIIKFCLEHDPVSIKDFLNSHSPLIQTPSLMHKSWLSLSDEKTLQSSFLLLICKNFINSKDEGTLHLYFEIFVILLDTSTLSRHDVREKFLEVFYSSYSMWLFQPIISLDQLDQVGASNSTLISLLIQILCFCIQKHNFRIKYFIVKNSLVYKICNALNVTRPKYMQLAALKFVKALLYSNDRDNEAFYLNYIIRNHSLDPYFELLGDLLRTKSEGLLYSCCLDILNIIVKKNNSKLIDYISGHEKAFEIISHIEVSGINESFKEAVISVEVNNSVSLSPSGHMEMYHGIEENEKIFTSFNASDEISDASCSMTELETKENCRNRESLPYENQVTEGKISHHAVTVDSSESEDTDQLNKRPRRMKAFTGSMIDVSLDLLSDSNREVSSPRKSNGMSRYHTT